MSKKHKKKHLSDGPKPLISRKLRRRVIRLVILALISSTAYAFYDPSIIQDKNTRDKVVDLKAKALGASEQIGERALEELPKKINLSAINQKLPQGVVLGEKEIKVDDTAAFLTQKALELPQDKLQQFKTSFCADLVYQATASARR